MTFSLPTLLTDLLHGALATVIITLGSWALACVAGLLLVVLREIRSRAVSGAAGWVIIVLRSIPQIVALYLLYFGVTIGQMNPYTAAIVGLGLTEAGYTAEYYRAALSTVPRGQYEAGSSIGLGRLAVLRDVVLPQAFPVAIPPLLNAFIGLLKAATVASAVGVPEVLYRANNEISLTGDVVPVSVTVAVVYVVVTLPMVWALRPLERRIGRGVRGAMPS